MSIKKGFIPAEISFSAFCAPLAPHPLPGTRLNVCNEWLITGVFRRSPRCSWIVVRHRAVDICPRRKTITRVFVQLCHLLLIAQWLAESSRMRRGRILRLFPAMIVNSYGNVFSAIFDGIWRAIRSKVRFVDLKLQKFATRWRIRHSMKTGATYSYGEICFKQHCRRPYPNPSWYNRVIRI